MNEEVLKNLMSNINEKTLRIDECSPQLLAYLGDAIYEVYVRVHLVSKGFHNSLRLHKASVSMVKAQTQASILSEILCMLNDEEKDIVRRGRNCKGGTLPKKASISEYRNATGFETLIGYLFIKGDYNRLDEVVKKAVESRDYSETKK